jgi:hypothetical protein
VKKLRPTRGVDRTEQIRVAWERLEERVSPNVRDLRSLSDAQLEAPSPRMPCGFQRGDARGTAFATARLAAGATALRDMIVDAWEDNRVTGLVSGYMHRATGFGGSHR